MVPKESIVVEIFSPCLQPARRLDYFGIGLRRCRLQLFLAYDSRGVELRA
jgi:hypothetical protein